MLNCYTQTDHINIYDQFKLKYLLEENMHSSDSHFTFSNSYSSVVFMMIEYVSAATVSHQHEKHTE